MEIKCDHCGQSAKSLDVEYAWDGDIEHTFFYCPECKATFPIAATDIKLRAGIAEYGQRRNFIRIHPVSEHFLRETETLKQENLKRNHELMEQHPLALFLEAHADILERLEREAE